jgi:hypothetical protein
MYSYFWISKTGGWVRADFLGKAQCLLLSKVLRAPHGRVPPMVLSEVRMLCIVFIYLSFHSIGAHFDPFDQKSLGPDIPALYTERNQGLVLSRELQLSQVMKQTALVMDIEGRIEWLTDNIEWAVMDAHLRSRKGKEYFSGYQCFIVLS